MTIQQTIYDKIQAEFAPSVLEIQNESRMHGLPASAERHFRVVLVSDKFTGQSRVNRQRAVHSLLAEELKAKIHALSLQIFTLKEWEERHGQTHASPECAGGGKHDKHAKR